MNKTQNLKIIPSTTFKFGLGNKAGLFGPFPSLSSIHSTSFADNSSRSGQSIYSQELRAQVFTIACGIDMSEKSKAGWDIISLKTSWLHDFLKHSSPNKSMAFRATFEKSRPCVLRLELNIYVSVGATENVAQSVVGTKNARFNVG